MLRTNSKQYETNFAAYVADCIEIEDKPDATLSEKLAYALHRFEAEYGYPAAKKSHPNHQARLAQWLAGLPLHFAFSYCDITETACKLHQDNNIPGKTMEKILGQWFDHCALMLLRLAAKQGIKP